MVPNFPRERFTDGRCGEWRSTLWDPNTNGLGSARKAPVEDDLALS